MSMIGHNSGHAVQLTCVKLATVSKARARLLRATRARAKSLSGTWLKDTAASESPDATCESFELGFVVRQAIGLLRTMKIEDTPEYFSTSLNAYVLDIKEQYKKSGEPAVYNRRDLRSGTLTGRFELSDDGHPSIVAEWEEPVKGKAVDVFELSDDGTTLTQQTTYTRHSNGEVTSYKTVHRLQSAS